MEIMDAFDFSRFNESQNETACIIKENQSSKFSILFSIECVIASVAILVNILFLFIIRKVEVMPTNVRILLIHLSISFVWASAAMLHKAITFLTTPDPCSLRSSAFECKIRGLPLSLPSGATFYSLIGICAERLCSTFYKRQRDNAATPPIMAIVFILIIWIGSGWGVVNLFRLTVGDRIVPVCEATFTIDHKSAVTSIAGNLILEIAAISVMLAVSAYENYVAKNMAINRVLYSLTSRFIIIQNVEVNALMLPSVLLHSLCYIPNMVFYMLVVFRTPMEPSTKWMIIHITYIWRLFYSICHPILAFTRNFHVKKQLMKSRIFLFITSLWNKKKPTVAATCTTEGACHVDGKMYFNYLEQIWSSAYRRQN